jgi:lysophospholipase L1-like esterase
MRKVFVGMAISVLSTAFTLLFLEIGLRIAGYVSADAERFEDLQKGEYEKGNRREFKPSIRISRNPRIIYEFEPNLHRIDKYGKKHTANAVGFRGPLYPIEKGRQTVRIVGLGDSVMYGSGVSDGENFLSLLSQKLNKAYPEKSWEIINTAVPGYNTVMEVETLKDKGLAYDPDIVLIMHVGNDISLPNLILDRDDPVCYLCEFVKSRLSLLPRRREQLVQAPKDEENHWFVRDPDKVPAQYRDMVGVEAYHRAMKELQVLSERYDFELIVLNKTPRNYVTETCYELNLRLVHFKPAIDQYMHEHNINKWLGSVLSVSEDNPHPSAVGHRIYADVVFDYLERSGVIKR